MTIEQFVNISMDNIRKYTIIFCWKNVRILCIAFSTKNNSVLAYVVGNYLMNRGLNDGVKLTKF